MRWLVAIALLAVPATCWQLAFSSDHFGHYVPHNTSGADCPLDPKLPAPALPQTMQLRTAYLSLESEDEEMEEEVPSRWGDCGIGGVPRLAAALVNKTLKVTAGNILGDGNWELPVDFSAAVKAAALFDVMGLGPGEFLRGVPFLSEFLTAVNESTERQTSIVACNVKSDLLGDLVKTSVLKEDVFFIGVVDPAVVEGYLDFDSDIQLSNISCVQDLVNKQKSNPSITSIVVVGSAGSLNSAILNVTGVTAFILSGLPDADKAAVRQGLPPGAAGNAAVLVTPGYGEAVGYANFTGGVFTNISRTLDSGEPDDTKTAEAIAELQGAVTDFYDTSVTSYFDLTSNKCNSTECSIGDVICDAALIGSLLDGRVTSRPMAVWPGQNLTGHIPKGKLTVGQLFSILPSDQVAIANASGDTVIQLFARAVQDMTVDASASNTFLQVSGVRVTYDLDLPEQYRPKYLMNLCLTCTPQEYLPISAAWNYTIVLPVSMLGHPFWSDITSKFTGVHITGFSARDAVAAKAQATGRLLSPVGDRIGFTHIPPDLDPTPDTFVTVLSTVVVCMVVFGLGLFGFHLWSRKQSQFGSNIALLR